MFYLNGTRNEIFEEEEIAQKANYTSETSFVAQKIIDSFWLKSTDSLFVFLNGKLTLKIA